MRGRRGPLADTYPAAVAMVVLTLTPFLAVATAIQPLSDLITSDTGMTMRSLQLATAMANAAYAFGSVLAVQLAALTRQRLLLIGYVAAFTVGSAAVTVAPDGAVFIAGHVVQGLATGLLLVGAVPPLITRFGPSTIASTATTFNIGLFGAVALGPVVGGASAQTGTWRPLFAIVTLLALCGLVLAVLTYEDEPGPTDSPTDVAALGLVGGGSAALLFGVAELVDRRFSAAIVCVPVVAGVLLLVAFALQQAARQTPLVPVRKLVGVLPAAGTLAVVVGSAASVAMIDVAGAALDAKGLRPLHAGFLFWPQFVTAAVAAAVFARLFVSRWMPVLTFAGLVSLTAGGIVLTGVGGHGDAVTLAGSALVGFGVGGAVTPGFYTAAFTVSAEILDSVFAIVETLHGAAAFAFAPAMVQLATTSGGGVAVGARTAEWIAAAVAGVGALAFAAVLVGGRAGLHVPQVQPWLEEDEPAMTTPPLRAVARPARLAAGLAAVLGTVVVVAAARADHGHGPAGGPVLVIVGPPVLTRTERAALGDAARTSTATRFAPARGRLRAGRADAVLVLRSDGSRRLYVRAAPGPAVRALAARLRARAAGHALAVRRL